MLDTAVGSRWLARAQIAFGVVGAVGFVARLRIASPPLMIHLMPGILGLSLLLRASRGRSQEPPQQASSTTWSLPVAALACSRVP